MPFTRLTLVDALPLARGLLDKTPAVAGRVGRPRRRPDALPADRGYDHDTYRRLLRQRGIHPVIAKGGEPHGTGPSALC